MSRFEQQQLQFADEGSFNDQSSQSMSKTLATLRVDAKLNSGRSTDRSLQTRLWKQRPGYRMVRSCSLEFDVLSAGAQVDTSSGALAATPLHTLLSNGLGGSDLTGVGGVAGATATTTSFPNGTGTRPRGGLSRVGQAGDGKGEGQGTVWGNPNTALLVAALSAPGATDKLRAALTAYLKEIHLASQRFLLRFENDPAMQYILTGLVLNTWGIRYVSGEPPIETFGFLGAYWDETSGLAEGTEEQCDAHVSAGGSFFLNTVGTATRPTDETPNAYEMELTLNLGLEVEPGEVPGLPLCNTRGFVRKRTGDVTGQLRLVYPWEDEQGANAGGTEYDKDGSDSVYKHFLWTSSAGEGTDATEGRHVMAYLPNLFPIGDRPTFREWNGLPAQERVYAITEGTDETTDLSRSAFRFGRS